jgi:ankyrin repeat protein
MTKLYSENKQLFDTIISQNMEGEILKYSEFDIQALIDNKQIVSILKYFNFDAVNHILTNSVNTDYNKLVFFFCKYSANIKLIENVIEQVTDFNIVDDLGWSILHHICNRSNKNLNLIKFAVNKGVGVLLTSQKKETCIDILYRGCRSRVGMEFMKYFEDTFTNFICDDSSLYVKYLCRSRENIDTLLYLIYKYKLNVNKLIGKICKYQEFETIKRVIEEYGINIKSYAFSYLTLIICENFYYDIKAIKYFLDAKANFYCFNKKGQNTLTLICKYSKNFEVIQTIIDYYITNNHDLNSCDRFGNNALYYLCCKCEEKGKYDGMLYLLSVGCSKDITYKKGVNQLSISDILKRVKIPKKQETFMLRKLNISNKEDNIVSSSYFINKYFVMFMIALYFWIYFTFV